MFGKEKACQGSEKWRVDGFDFYLIVELSELPVMKVMVVISYDNL